VLQAETLLLLHLVLQVEGVVLQLVLQAESAVLQPVLQVEGVA